jgi:hypothetical protein
VAVVVVVTQGVAEVLVGSGLAQAYLLSLELLIP